MKHQTTRKILFAIPPEVHLLDINGPAHIFYEAKNFGANLELHFISLNEESEIRTSAGLFFNRLESFKNFTLNRNDVLFIPGLEFFQISDKQFVDSLSPFLEWVTRQYKNHAHICSICTGSFILAETGILNGKSSTTHWKYLDVFSERFPEVELLENRLFISSGNIHSSAGVSSGIDLSLYLIEDFFGTKFALELAKEVVIYFRRSPTDPQLSVFLQYRDHLDQRIHNAQDFIIKNLFNPPKIEEVANKVHMSKRNLTRLFKNTTGITIGRYVEILRVERALTLLSEGHKNNFVISQVGLKSTNQLRALLKKHKSVLPSDLK